MSYYEINVAKRYKDYMGKDRYSHYFATADRSLQSEEKMKEVLTDFRKAFPEPEFEISVSKRIEYWQRVNIHLYPETTEQNHDK